MIYLETERLYLRSWNYEDLPHFRAMNRDSKVMKYFPSTQTDEETDLLYKRIVAEFEEKGYGLYAVELKETGEFIGYTGLHHFDFDADFSPGTEIGWRLKAEHHNKGYATEAATAVLKHAEKMGLKEIYSFTARINLPSERVMRKIGMTKTGTFKHPRLPETSPLQEHVLYITNF